jgi:peptidoglycan-N-acetylglucosamine deacetylase
MPDNDVIVTTSWDDGHELDEKLADLLADYGFAGTFYISPRSAEIPPHKRLCAMSLGEIARRFEIGNHTLTHPHLTRLPLSEVDREIRLGADALQEIIGRSVTSFCYPYGAYRAQHVRLVQAAGFRVARTIRRFCTTAPTDPLQMGTTIHAARYLADGWPVLRRCKTPRQVSAMWGNWDVLARRLFQEVQEHGGVYHLWGHSWEIEAHGDWSRLRSLLRFITEQDVTFVTNAELAGEAAVHDATKDGGP